MIKFLSKDSIGEVDTPLPWAVWVAERYGIVNRWLEGATVLDPTMGEGNLLEALLYGGIQRGIPFDRLPIDTLYGIERQGEKLTRFFKRIQDRYRLELPRENFLEADILLDGIDSIGTSVSLKGAVSVRAEWQEALSSNHIPPVDILFGNPPWITFASLPQAYKNQIKELFLRYSLVPKKNQALLGRSRVDLSALIVLLAISRFLRPGGEAVFFLPLSLFYGEGAGEGFRRFRSGDIPFHVREVVELPMEKVFPGVSTRGGVVYVKRDEEQQFPVRVYRMQKGSRGSESVYPMREYVYEARSGARGEDSGRPYHREKYEEKDFWVASPIDGPESSWILYQGKHPFPEGLPRIPLPKESFPRQGINTCGANELFFFNSVEEEEKGVWRVSNSTLTCHLPSAYLYPLLTSESFREHTPIPHKWVFLPYREDGHPLSPQHVEEDPLLKQFLGQHEERLRARKGVLIQQRIRKGCFWALFGVGAYCFYPWKVVWEAAGRKKFRPRIWEGRWQANQSLHGYLPFKSLQEAMRVLEALQNPRIEAYLQAPQAQGTLNWAQPGRMRRLFISACDM